MTPWPSVPSTYARFEVKATNMSTGRGSGAGLETLKGHLRNHEMTSQLSSYVYNLLFGPQRRVQAYLITGIVKGTNLSSTTTYVGTYYSAYQFATLIYSEPFRVRRSAKFPSRCAIVFSNKCQTDIVAIHVEEPLAQKYTKADFLLLPNLCFILDLRRSIEEILQKMSRRRRRDLKKIEESNCTYTIYKQDSDIFELYYWKMYLPYSKKRFGEAAYIKTFSESKIMYELNGGIIIVEKDEQPLAGILFQIRNRTLLAWSLGTFEGNQELVSFSQAALFYLVKWAKAEGIERLDYGVSLPFFTDGVFTYKKEWGMSAAEPANNSFWALKLNSLTEGSLAFLKQNPFVVHESKSIKGVILLDHRPDKAEFQNLFAQYYLPELASLIVLSYYHDSATGSSSQINPRNSRERIHGYNRSLQHIRELLQEQGYSTQLIELKSTP